MLSARRMLCAQGWELEAMKQLFRIYISIFSFIKYFWYVLGNKDMIKSIAKNRKVIIKINKKFLLFKNIIIYNLIKCLTYF